MLAAGSVVGTAAIQVAKHFGCRVIATASSDEKLAKAKALGADAVINYAGSTSTAGAELTDGRGVDVVIEHVGADTWQHSVAALAPLGRVVTCGSPPAAGATPTCGRCLASRSACWLLRRDPEEFLALLPLVVDGTLKTVIDRTFPLEQAADTHRYMADGSSLASWCWLLPPPPRAAGRRRPPAHPRTSAADCMHAPEVRCDVVFQRLTA